MARAELGGEKRIHRQRKKACGGCDAILLHNNCSVMKRSAGAKDGREEIIGEPSVERYTTFDVGTESDFTLDDDEGTSLMLREKIGSEHDVVVCVGFC